MAPVNNNEPTFNPIFKSEIIMTKMVEQEKIEKQGYETITSFSPFERITFPGCCLQNE
jgi:hypothetical protein